MKYCPTSTVVRIPASVPNLITRFCRDSLSTRSWYFCNRSSSCAGSSVKGVGVFHQRTCLEKQWVRLSHHNKSPCSYMAGFVFLTQMWDCSEDTELINRNNCAKKFQSFPDQRRSVLIIFHLLCFWAFFGTVDSWHAKLGVRFLQIFSSSIPRLCHIHLVVLRIMSRIPHLFWSRSEEWPSFWWKIFLRMDRQRGVALAFAFPFIVFRSPWDVVEHRHEDDPSIVLALRSFLTGTPGLCCRAAMWWILWKYATQNSIGSPSFVSKNLYCDELLNHVNLSSQTVFACGFSFIVPTHNTESENM